MGQNTVRPYTRAEQLCSTLERGTLPQLPTPQMDDDKRMVTGNRRIGGYNINNRPRTHQSRRRTCNRQEETEVAQ